MKKIILSAAVAAMAFSTSAVAADKGIDIDVSGQAVVYYETHDDNGAQTNVDGSQGLFGKNNSVAAAGVQLNLGSDLGNNFTFGSQLTYLGTLGLEKSVVDGIKQSASASSVNGNTTDNIALTKIFIAKKIANTTIKAGRQELPKSLSPLAFTEGWQVFKNTFDAILAVNTDLPKTTLVGAYVTGGTSMSLATVGNLPSVAGAAYMATAQTKLIPMTTLTGTYYKVYNVLGNNSGGNSGLSPTAGIDANAMWADAQIAPKDAPLGLKIGLQAGQIDPESATYTESNAFGAKVAGKVGAISFKAIYTTVDGDDTKSQLQVRNLGTNTKSPLYSQMMYNQQAIGLDSDTVVLGVAYDAGSMGKFAANYGMSDIGKNNGLFNTGATSIDYNELDLVYKVKAGGVQYFAIAAIRDIDTGGTMNTTINGATGSTKDNIVRFWARYNF